MKNLRGVIYQLGFFVGLLMVLGLNAITTWADVEAAFYGFDRRGGRPLRGLVCPVLLGKDETGTISLNVKNPTGQKLKPTIQADFSARGLYVSTTESILLQPGESRTLQWTIGPENIVLNRFIFSTFVAYAFYPLPDGEVTCGTFVIPFAVPGVIVLLVWVLTGFSLMIGSWVSLRSSPGWLPRRTKFLSPMGYLVILSAVTLAVSLAGFWVLAVLLMAVSILSIVVVINFSVL